MAYSVAFSISFSSGMHFVTNNKESIRTPNYLAKAMWEIQNWKSGIYMLGII